MDNECYSDLKQAMKKYNIDFQLASPHMHRRNSAEWAIRTYKDLFIYGFLTIYPDSPIRKWDRLRSQCVITLKLIQNSRVNLALSAYAYLFVPYDFNKSPTAPHGTCVILHEKLATAHHGAIMAHLVGILVRNLTTTDVCCVTCPLLS